MSPVVVVGAIGTVAIWSEKTKRRAHFSLFSLVCGLWTVQELQMYLWCSRLPLKYACLPKEVLQGIHMRCPNPPLVASTLGIRLSTETLCAIHESVSCIEPYSVACKIIGNVFSSKRVQELLQGAFLALVKS